MFSASNAQGWEDELARTDLQRLPISEPGEPAKHSCEYSFDIGKNDTLTRIREYLWEDSPVQRAAAKK